MPIPRKLNLLDYSTGELIKTYRSIIEASVELSVDKAYITEAIRSNEGKMPKRRLRFSYADHDDAREGSRSYKVRQIDYDTGEEIEIYDNVHEAARKNGLASVTIRSAIKNRGGFIKSKGLRFKYALDLIK